MKPLSRRVGEAAFSLFLYRHRNCVERLFNELKHFRTVATRYEKLANKLAAARIWMRAYASVSEKADREVVQGKHYID